METIRKDRQVEMEEPRKIRKALTREKETLVSMFLSNASHAEMAAQYSIIENLCHLLREHETAFDSSSSCEHGQG